MKNMIKRIEFERETVQIPLHGTMESVGLT